MTTSTMTTTTTTTCDFCGQPPITTLRIQRLGGYTDDQGVSHTEQESLCEKCWKDAEDEEDDEYDDEKEEDDEEEEEDWFDGKYPDASCFRCSERVDGKNVVYCGGGGGACETWYCTECYEDGTHDCNVCK